MHVLYLSLVMSSYISQGVILFQSGTHPISVVMSFPLLLPLLIINLLRMKVFMLINSDNRPPSTGTRFRWLQR